MFLKRLKWIAEWTGLIFFAVLCLSSFNHFLKAELEWDLFGFLNGHQALAAPFGTDVESARMVSAEMDSVPLYMDYEGYLTNMDGAPLTGYYTITLRIYEGVADPIGEELWSEVHTNVPVRDGRFSVLMGNNVPLLNEFFTSPDRFIGVSVIPFDEMVPRQRLASAPYAIQSHYASHPYIPSGTVWAYAGTTPPEGWLLCDGSEVSRTQYSELFVAIGTTWGIGNGSTTFNLPDLRGRIPIGSGQGTGLTNRILGAYGGAETHTLTIAEMPAHTHNLTTVPSWNSGGGWSGSTWFGDPIPLTTSSTGGDQPHNIMNPFAAITFIVKQ